TPSHNASMRERALGVLDRAAAATDRAADPYHCASAYIALGDALVISAQGEKRQKMLNEAVQAYETARLALPFEVAPFEWINLHFKLGNTSGTLAREAKDTGHIYVALSILETGLQRLPTGLFKLLRAEILIAMAQLHLARAIGEHWQRPLRRGILAYD